MLNLEEYVNSFLCENKGKTVKISIFSKNYFIKLIKINKNRKYIFIITYFNIYMF